MSFQLLQIEIWRLFHRSKIQPAAPIELTHSHLTYPFLHISLIILSYIQLILDSCNRAMLTFLLLRRSFTINLRAAPPSPLTIQEIIFIWLSIVPPNFSSLPSLSMISPFSGPWFYHNWYLIEQLKLCRFLTPFLFSFSHTIIDSVEQLNQLWSVPSGVLHWDTYCPPTLNNLLR